MRGVSIILAMAAFSASTAMADPALKTKAFPAAKLFPYYQNYLELPAAERDQFRMAFFLTAAEGPLTATLKRPGGDVPLTLGARGEISPLPTLADLKTAQVELTAHDGVKLNAMIELVEAMAPAQTLDATTLKKGIDQARNGARKAAGLLGAMVPDYESVCFVGAGSGNVILADGKTVPLKVSAAPNNPQHPNPCFTPADMPTARQVVLAHVPSLMPIARRPQS